MFFLKEGLVSNSSPIGFVGLLFGDSFSANVSHVNNLSPVTSLYKLEMHSLSQDCSNPHCPRTIKYDVLFIWNKMEHVSYCLFFLKKNNCPFFLSLDTNSELHVLPSARFDRHLNYNVKRITFNCVCAEI